MIRTRSLKTMGYDATVANTPKTHTHYFFYEVEISKKKLSQEKPFVNAVVKV